MAAVPMLAGVGLMMVCCSSSSAAMMMGGSEETPATATATTPTGPSAPTTTTFVGSEIPNDALVIEPGEIPMLQVFNSPKDSTDAESTYYLNLQGDGQLVWVNRGTGTAWALGSPVTMPNTKVYFQGDGNICATGGGQGGNPHCTQQAAGGVLTYNGDVPAGQHRLVGTKEGMLYVDHGTGVAGRAVLYTPPSTTETYVLPY